MGRRLDLTHIALAVWLPSVISLAAYLFAGHFALPEPSRDTVTLRDQVARSRRPDGPPLVLHFLYGDCRCSAAVLDHLVARGPRAGHDERIVLIDGRHDEDARARAAGFQTELLTAQEEMATYGVEGAPFLVVADRANSIVYAGGYTTAKQSPLIRDEIVLAAIERGEAVPPLPTFGCAVSDRMKQSRDPLALRR